MPRRSRASVEELLRGAGHEVSTTDLCHDVLELAQKNKVDMVVLDTGLPGPGCSDLLSELKSVSIAAGLRVILLKPAEMQKTHPLQV